MLHSKQATKNNSFLDREGAQRKKMPSPFIDQRTETSIQRQQQQLMVGSSQALAQQKLIQRMQNSPLNQNNVLQQTVVQKQNAVGTGLDGLQSKIKWATSQISGDSTNTIVGINMLADPLGPDHLQGGPPKSGAQKGLMRQLPTDPKLSNNQKYIRGHLLNDNLGGPGEDYNLFPITGEANHNHEQFMESTVKKWVNDQRQWVRYSVVAKAGTVNLPAKTVNANFDCEAQLLDPTQGMKTIDTVKVTIPSVYGGHPPIDTTHTAAAGVTAPVGNQSSKYNVLLSLAKKNANEYKLNDKLFEAIEGWAGLYKGSEILSYQKIATIGKALGALFEDIVEDALKFGNVPQSLDKGQKASLTKLNKKAEDLIRNLNGLIQEDFGEAFLKMLLDDPSLDSYTSSYTPSNESILDHLPPISSSYDDFSSGGSWMSQSHQGVWPGSQPGFQPGFQPNFQPHVQPSPYPPSPLGQQVAIHQQSLSTLGHNYLNSYSTQFNNIYFDSFSTSNTQQDNYDLLTGDYEHQHHIYTPNDTLMDDENSYY